MKKTICIILLLLPMAAVYGETPELQFSVSWYGDWLVNPGIMGTVQAKWENGLGVGVKLGGYAHPGYKWIFQTTPIVSYTFEKLPVWKPDILLGAGLGVRGIASNSGFFEGDGNTVIPSTDSSEVFFVPIVGIGLLNFGFPVGNNEMSIIGRCLITGEYPYNGYILPHIGMELGVSYEL